MFLSLFEEKTHGMAKNCPESRKKNLSLHHKENIGTSVCVCITAL